MVRTLVLFLLMAFGMSSLSAKDYLSTQIEHLNETVKKVGVVETQNKCSSIESDVNYKKELDTVYSAFNKKKIELSVISESYAQEIFKTLKDDEENSFNYPLDGCYARAEKMAMIMDDMGVTSGKAFIEGDLLVETSLGDANWSYHVASLVMVKINGVNTPTIMDPSLFDKPVPYTEWKALILKRKESKFQTEYFTKRFNYDPDSRYDDMESYPEDQIEDMKETLRKNKMTGEVLQSMNKDE